MALNSTIIKVNLSISNLDDHYYQDHHLTVAQHPSENTQRMMLAVVAFILNAQQEPQFTKGLSATDEPALWKKNLIEDIELWIELGQPDMKKLKKACRQSGKVVILSYNDTQSQLWFQANEKELKAYNNLSILHVPNEQYQQLAEFNQRQLNISATLQDGELWLNTDDTSATVQLQTLL